MKKLSLTIVAIISTIVLADSDMKPVWPRDVDPGLVEFCHFACEHHLGKDKMGQGFAYTNCFNSCVERKGLGF